MGLMAVYPKRKLSNRNEDDPVYPYLLKENPPLKPNDCWAVDITYIRICGGYAYLRAIIDWVSRRIMGWNLSPFLDASSCLEALNQGLKKESPKMVNSDQGRLIIDELHALQKLEYLEESLAELRKYGGAIVLATQNVSQLDKIYRHHGARIILDQCDTKVSFRQSDAEIAKRMSSFFGQREFRETQEGLSYGLMKCEMGSTYQA